MGRKSLAKERHEDILNAFEDCIVMHGLQASSLEKIAEQGNFSRNTIRHYIGNRDDLIAALVERLIQRYNNSYGNLFSMLPREDRLRVLLDWLFGYTIDHNKDIVLFNELFAASSHDASIKQHLLKLHQNWEDGLVEEFKFAFPKAKRAQICEAAYAILCLNFADTSMMGLGFDSNRRKAARKAADSIIETLAVT